MGDVISSSSSYYAYAGGISGYNELCAITNCVVLSKKITANKNQYIIGNGGIKSGNLAITGITGNPIDDSDGRITKSQAQQQSTYTGIGWDFINVWNIDEGQSYPYLRNVIGLIDPSTEGKITAYMYDRLGRLTKIIFDSGVSVSYTYDSVGNILDVNVEVPLSYSLNSLSKRGGVE